MELEAVTSSRLDIHDSVGCARRLAHENLHALCDFLLIR